VTNALQVPSCVAPTDGQESWYDTFAAFVNAVDLTVYSIAQEPPPPRYTTIISARADPAYAMVGSTGATNYRVLSMAPFGAFAGSFRIVNSGASACFFFTTHGYDETAPGSAEIADEDAGGSPQIFTVSLVVNSGLANTVTYVSGGPEIFPDRGGFDSLALYTSGPRSLAPGDYNVLVIANVFTFANVGSRWVFPAGSPQHLTMLEVRSL